MKKKKKNSLLTIGAFAIVGVLIVGTILGIATGGLSSGDDKGKVSIPITDQAERADSSTSSAVVAGEKKEQSKEKDTNTTAKNQPAESKNDAETTAEPKEAKATKKPKTTKQPKQTKKPKQTSKPKDNNDKKPDGSLVERDATGEDNEISFSDFQ